MAEASGGSTGSPEVTVTGEQAEMLIEKLADDEFRDKLQADPVAALREIGIELPPGTTLRGEDLNLPSIADIEIVKPVPLKFAPVFGKRCPIRIDTD